MRFDKILASVEAYYNEKIEAFGPTAKGVDWNSTESQVLRFEQLLKICDTSKEFSINDYGCGYGALVDHMMDRRYSFRYRGFDISEEMIGKAKEVHEMMGHCKFVTEESRLSKADYTVASGLFNVKLQTSDSEWKEYVLHTLGRIAELSEKGFAFNALTKYSDLDHLRSDLYYADPCFLFDFCKKHFSKFVALLHDYPLYEFTILVRK